MPAGGAGLARQKRTDDPMVGLGMRVPASTRARGNDLAARLGLSLNGVVALLLEHADLDEQGRLQLVPRRPRGASGAPPSGPQSLPGQLTLPALEDTLIA